jgi:hypothetical protein
MRSATPSRRSSAQSEFFPSILNRKRDIVMKRHRILINAAFVGLLSISAMACNSTSTSESTGEYVDDAVISSKVRADIIGDKDLKLTQIDVETYKGTVQLSGFVDTIQTKWRAGSVAGNVKGVRQVSNNLIVK